MASAAPRAVLLSSASAGPAALSAPEVSPARLARGALAFWPGPWMMSRPGSDAGGSHQSPAAVKVRPVPARNPARAELPAMVRVAGPQIASNSGQDAYLCASDFTKFNEVTKSNF